MTTEITYDQITNWLYATEIQFDEVSDVVRTDYSGRGMYGRDCFGLVLDSTSDIMDFILAVSYDDRDLADALSRNLTEDSMGLSGIYYFPRFAVTEVPA